MEQGPEASAFAGTKQQVSCCGEPRKRKGERARFAVNVRVGNGSSGDAGPRRPGFVPVAVAVGGGKASKGSRCTAGNSVSRQKETW